MQRDLDLIKRILYRVEECQVLAGVHKMEIEGVKHDVINYHLFLLYDKGLITGKDTSTSNSFGMIHIKLTWAGHDHVEELRKND